MIVRSNPRKHKEGYAVDLYNGQSKEIRLATVYGATVAEAVNRSRWIMRSLEILLERGF